MISAFTNRALRFLSSEVRGLHAAAYVLAVSAFLSSLLALVRDRLLAHTFGAGITLDTYNAAFRIPDLIFVATGALVSVYVLIPELSRRSEAEQRDYIDTVLFAFSFLAVAASGIAFLIAPSLLAVLFPKFAGAAMPRLVLLTRIMLLQPILLGFSNILAAITQSRHRYALYSVSQLLYNLGIIVGVVVLYPAWGIAGLAWGVVFGAAMHCGVQVPSLISEGFLRRMPRLREPAALLRTAAVSVPRALALSMTQLTYLGLIALAGTLATGSIAIFQFAYNLQSVPLAVIGASYSVAAFPTLASALSKGEREQFIGLVAAAARYVYFWSIPASMLVLVLRAYLVRVILGSGAFNWTDTRLTAAAFALLSLSLAAQGITLLLVRGYYAAGRTFIPFFVTCFTALGTVVLGFLTIHALRFDVLGDLVERLMRVEGIPGSSVLGLAFAYAIVTITGTVVLMLHFEHRYRGFFAQTKRAFLESVLAGLIGSIAAYAALVALGPFFDTTATLSVFAVGFAGGIVGLAGTIAAYFMLGSREFAEVFASFRARLWRESIAAEEISIAASAEEQVS